MRRKKVEPITPREVIIDGSLGLGISLLVITLLLGIGVLL